MLLAIGFGLGTGIAAGPSGVFKGRLVADTLTKMALYNIDALQTLVNATNTALELEGAS